MKVTRLLTDDSGVSEVIGVVLMVAITVLLAATAATFFIGFNDDTEKTPQAAIQFDYNDGREGGSPADELVIKHNGGDTLDADQLTVKVEKAEPASVNDRYDWTTLASGTPSEIKAGHSIRVSDGTVGTSQLSMDDATVTVSWENPSNGQTFTLSRWGN